MEEKLYFLLYSLHQWKIKEPDIFVAIITLAH